MIRGLSDLAGGQNGENDIDLFQSLASSNVAKAVIQFIKLLSIKPTNRSSWELGWDAYVVPSSQNAAFPNNNKLNSLSFTVEANLNEQNVLIYLYQAFDVWILEL